MNSQKSLKKVLTLGLIRAVGDFQIKIWHPSTLDCRFISQLYVILPWNLTPNFQLEEPNRRTTFLHLHVTPAILGVKHTHLLLPNPLTFRATFFTRAQRTPTTPSRRLPGAHTDAAELITHPLQPGAPHPRLRATAHFHL